MEAEEGVWQTETDWGGGRLGTEEAEGEKKPRKERGRRGGFRDDRLRRVGVG